MASPLIAVCGCDGSDTEQGAGGGGTEPPPSQGPDLSGGTWIVDTLNAAEPVPILAHAASSIWAAWSRRVDIFNNAAFVARLQAHQWTPEPFGNGDVSGFAGHGDRLHLVYNRADTLYFELYYRQFDGAAWLPERALTVNSSPGGAHEALVATDADGVAYVLYRTSDGLDNVLFGVIPADGIVNPVLVKAAAHCTPKDLVVGAGGVAYARADCNEENEWFTNASGSWAPTNAFSSSDADVRFARTADGELRAMWLTYGTECTTISVATVQGDAVVGTPRELEECRSIWSTAHAVGPHGRSHIAYSVSEGPTDLAVFTVIDDHAVRIDPPRTVAVAKVSHLSVDPATGMPAVALFVTNASATETKGRIARLMP